MNLVKNTLSLLSQLDGALAEETYSPINRRGKLPLNDSAAAAATAAVASQALKAGTPEYYPCPICGKVSRRKDYLRIHLRTHTGERPYYCNYCPHRSIQKSDLNKHLKTHLLSCNLCNFTTYSQQELQTHNQYHQIM